MTEPESFSEWWRRLCGGDEGTAGEAFRLYRDRLLRLAAGQFDTWVRDRADPEGVLQSVFRSFFVRAQGGQLDVESWEHLWALLTVITLRKCCNRLTYLQAARRQAGRDREGVGPLLAIPDRAPDPAEAAALAETVEGLLAGFDPPERALVELILQGHGVGQIVEQTGRAERTVRRLRERVRVRLERMTAEAV
jgi:RNA polymerase sigma-70 factor (ECF subfamily)